MRLAEELLERVALRYTCLKNAGRDRKCGLSPFRQEKHPSFYVYPDGYYHDFGNGFHGDAIDLVMRMENLSFPDALAFLEREFGVTIPRDDGKTFRKGKTQPKQTGWTPEHRRWMLEDRKRMLHREDLWVLYMLQLFDRQALSAWGICDRTYQTWHWADWMLEEWFRILKREEEEIKNAERELRNE